MHGWGHATTPPTIAQWEKRAQIFHSHHPRYFRILLHDIHVFGTFDSVVFGKFTYVKIIPHSQLDLVERMLK